MDRVLSYTCRKGTLTPGTRFWASGGPYYRHQNGIRTAMNEHGPFRFCAYQEHEDGRRLIVATGPNGFLVLSIGPEYESRSVEGLVVRPYRITRVESNHNDQENEMNAKKNSGKKTVAKEPKAAKVEKVKEGPKAVPKEPKAEAKKEGKLSCLDAAAQVLAGAKEPMSTREMVAAAADRGLWSSPGGKTPEATLYSAIIREIAKKGEAARFSKSDRGRFVARNA